jgi:hypothetical protein
MAQNNEVHSFALADFTDEQLSSQLARLESVLFQRIAFTEFLRQAWMKKVLPGLALR